MESVPSSKHITDTVTGDEIESIRPAVLSEYIGQRVVREQMQLFIDAARQRNEPLEHTLIFGPPGLGKTTLAHIISRELKSNLKSTSGPVLEKAADIAALLTNLDYGDVLFIDEIHRINHRIEEVLYPAMEDYKIDIVMGEGVSARSIKLELEPFTLVGATTRSGLLTSPLRDRFGIVQRLHFYNVDELKLIILRNAKILGVGMDHDGAMSLAERARGTPRIANRLLRRTRDYAQVLGDGNVTADIALKALEMLNIDVAGLDHIDRQLLATLVEKFNGGPVGIDSLAIALNEERETVEEVIEPYLIQQGYIMRSARGRLATERAYSHLNITYPAKNLATKIPLPDNQLF